MTTKLELFSGEHVEATILYQSPGVTVEESPSGNRILTIPDLGEVVLREKDERLVTVRDRSGKRRDGGRGRYSDAVLIRDDRAHMHLNPSTKESDGQLGRLFWNPEKPVGRAIYLGPAYRRPPSAS